MASVRIQRSSSLLCKRVLLLGPDVRSALSLGHDRLVGRQRRATRAAASGASGPQDGKFPDGTSALGPLSHPAIQGGPPWTADASSEPPPASPPPPSRPPGSP